MYPSPDPRLYCRLESVEALHGLGSDRPPPGLLSPAEGARFAGFAAPKRRRDWLLGRWTAKHLVQAYLARTCETPLPLDRIEILADEDGAPYAQVGARLPVSLSISHSGRESFCAVCASKSGWVGADIEMVEPRDLSFVRTFFTADENAAVEAATFRDRNALITALWSTKEAVLKTLRLGLRADTRQVEVRIDDLVAQWTPTTVTVDPALLPAPSARISAWRLIEPDRVLSLALLSIG